jgi:hypothetical protein
MVTVGGGENNSGVSDRAGTIIVGSVEVLAGRVEGVVISPWMPEAQLVLNTKTIMALLTKRRDTPGF